MGLRNLSFFSLFFNLAWVVLVCFTLFSLFHSFTNGRSPRCTARRLCTLLLDCVGLLWVDRVVDCLLPFVDYRYPPDSSGRSELDAMDLGFEMNGGNGWGGGFYLLSYERKKRIAGLFLIRSIHEHLRVYIRSNGDLH